MDDKEKQDIEKRLSRLEGLLRRLSDLLISISGHYKSAGRFTKDELDRPEKDKSEGEDEKE